MIGRGDPWENSSMRGRNDSAARPITSISKEEDEEEEEEEEADTNVKVRRKGIMVLCFVRVLRSSVYVGGRLGYTGVSLFKEYSYRIIQVVHPRPRTPQVHP